MQSNYSLKEHNSFHFDVEAKKYIEVDDFEVLRQYILDGKLNDEKIRILGGGSNMLFRDNFDGIVIHPVNETIEILEENDKTVLLKVAAGKDWDEFVEYTVNQGYQGLENLSLIPGQVGACPIQNIGAYGVEVKDCIEKVEGFFLETAEPFSIENEACRFGYRDSIFKRELKGKIFVSYVYFRLSLLPEYKLDYGALKERVESLGGASLKNIRQAVIEIREEKLPDPEEIGNAGSFFKNPVITESQLNFIKETHPEVRYFEQTDGFKVPAAWLIDTAGWKGYRKGDAGVHKNQALVLVNYGSAKPEEILALAKEIVHDVKEKFHITLEMEVSVI